MNLTPIQKFAAGMLLVGSAAAGMYATASTLAGAIGGNFNPAESNRHQHLAEFSAANRNAENSLGVAQFHCDRAFAQERLACRNSARQASIDAHTAARVKYKHSTSLPERVASARTSDPATLRIAAR